MSHWLSGIPFCEGGEEVKSTSRKIISKDAIACCHALAFSDKACAKSPPAWQSFLRDAQTKVGPWLFTWIDQQKCCSCKRNNSWL